MRKSLLLLISMLTTVTSWALTVNYMNSDGSTKSAQVTQLTGDETALGSGWYYVGSNLTYDHTIIFNAKSNVKIIIGNGYTMSMGTETTPISGDGIDGLTNGGGS